MTIPTHAGTMMARLRFKMTPQEPGPSGAQMTRVFVFAENGGNVAQVADFLVFGELPEDRRHRLADAATTLVTMALEGRRAGS